MLAYMGKISEKLPLEVSLNKQGVWKEPQSIFNLNSLTTTYLLDHPHWVYFSVVSPTSYLWVTVTPMIFKNVGTMIKYFLKK